MSATTTSTTKADTHRHGWRTGIALIASGRRPACELSGGGSAAVSVTESCLDSARARSVRGHARRADGVVVVEGDVRARDCSIGHVPLGQDVLVVVVVVHQVLESVGDRLLERAAFHYGDAIGRDAAGL